MNFKSNGKTDLQFTADPIEKCGFWMQDLQGTLKEKFREFSTRHPRDVVNPLQRQGIAAIEAPAVSADTPADKQNDTAKSEFTNPEAMTDHEAAIAKHLGIDQRVIEKGLRLAHKEIVDRAREEWRQAVALRNTEILRLNQHVAEAHAKFTALKNTRL